MQKKLYRSNTDKILGGVCGGVAEYLEIDSTIVRLLWVLACFTSVGVIGYIVALVIMPLPPVDYYHQNYNSGYNPNYNPNYQQNYNPQNNQGFYQDNNNQGSYQSQNNYHGNSVNQSSYQAEENTRQDYYEAESSYREETTKENE